MQSIRPISDLRNIFADVSREVHASDEPVIFTKNGEKADTYIERAVSQKSADYRFIVVTSDGPIQNAIFTKGAARLSSRAFISEYESLYKAMQRKLEKE